MQMRLGNRRIEFIAITYSILLITLHFLRIFDSNFWYDECWSTLFSRMSLAEILQCTAMDVHPPLYFIWIKLLSFITPGNPGWMFHLSAFIPYVLTLLFAFIKFVPQFGYKCYLFFATCLSLLESSITYAVEVRMYSLALLFITLAYWYLRNILIKGENRDYVSFSIYLLLSMYTHYYCGVPAITMFIIAFTVSLMKKSWDAAKKIIISAFCVTIGYMPWLYCFLTTMSRTQSDFWMNSVPSIKDCLLYLFSGRYVFALLRLMLACLLVAYCYTKIVIADIKNKSFCGPQFLWEMGGWMIVATIIVVGVGVSIFVRPMFITRYMYCVCGIVWLLVGIQIDRVTSKLLLKNTIFAILTLSVVVGGMQQYVSAYENEKDQGVRAEKTLELMTAVSSTDVIISDETAITGHVEDGYPQIGKIVQWYFPGVAYEMLGDDFFERMDNSKTYWVVLTYNQNVQYFEEKISKYDLKCRTIIENGNLGTCNCDVYRIN